MVASCNVNDSKTFAIVKRGMTLSCQLHGYYLAKCIFDRKNKKRSSEHATKWGTHRKCRLGDNRRDPGHVAAMTVESSAGGKAILATLNVHDRKGPNRP
jgi:hypothetical protein